MIQDKLMAGQLLLDLKTDRTHLLQTAAVVHHPHSATVPPFFTSPHMHSPSPPMPVLDLYSAYAYQQQLQQHLLAAPATALHHHQHPHQQVLSTVQVNNNSANCEVLDLSRRCDSVETNRKTPSPYHSNSSNGSISPTSSSPSTTTQALSTSSTAPITSHLLPSTQYQPRYSSSTLPVLPTPMPAINFAALYPGLRSIEPIKQETSANTATMPSITASNSITKTTIAGKSAETISSTYTNSLTAALTYPPPPSLVGNTSLLPTLNPLKPPEQSEVQKTIPGHPINTAVGTTTASNSNTNILPATESRPTRPFKAYPRDPLVIAANFAASDVLLDNPRVERYTEYRKRVLEQIRSSNGGSRTVSNPKMRRMNSRSISINEDNASDTEERLPTEESSDCDSNSGKQNNPTTSAIITTTTLSNSSTTNGNGIVVKDAAYYERRRKNNAAAKKSRDRRRIKEDEIAIRAAYLERQNIELLCQIDALKAQLASYTSKIIV